MIKCNLAYMLDKFRITQKELSEATDIPKNTINRYYNNTWTTINRDHIEELCNFFSCSVGDLIEVYSNTIHPNQMKLDLENSSNVVREECVDYTSKSRVQKPMDMIKQIQHNQRIQEYQENQAKHNFYNQNLFSGAGGLSNVQFKKEIVDDVSTEVYQRLIKYLNTLETNNKDKDKE